jgi:uncharacterized membrane protein YedE/YeeE
MQKAGDASRSGGLSRGKHAEAGAGSGRIADSLPAPRTGIVITGIVGMALLGYLILSGQGLQQGVLYGLGALLGVALFHARFGFTSAFRQLVAVGQGTGLKAHMLMLAVASVIFAPILSAGVGLFGVEPTGYIAPLGVSVVVGAFLFGLGMQLGGACASGTLYTIGSGQTAIVLTLFGFVLGSVLGAWHWGFWTQDAFNWMAIGLGETGLGYAGGTLVQLLFIGAIVAVIVLVSRRKSPPPVSRKPSARGLGRIVRGTWPLWVGALALASLNAAVLMVSGKPWGVTGAFALWGSKIVGALGVDVASWTYWAADPAPLQQSILANATTVTNFGIILGALVASAVGGTFVVHKRIPLRTIVAALLGGILMGYGARLAYGCNIGAYFGGVASLSLHGWLWAAMALFGTYGGLKLRPLFGLAVPKPKDSSC